MKKHTVYQYILLFICLGFFANAYFRDNQLHYLVAFIFYGIWLGVSTIIEFIRELDK